MEERGGGGERVHRLAPFEAGEWSVGGRTGIKCSREEFWNWGLGLGFGVDGLGVGSHFHIFVRGGCRSEGWGLRFEVWVLGFRIWALCWRRFEGGAVEV